MKQQHAGQLADIVGRLEKLEAQMQGSSFHTSTSKYTGRGRGQKTNGELHNTKSKSLGPIMRHTCHQEGHYAQGCASKKQSLGNTRLRHSAGGTQLPSTIVSVVPGHSYYLEAKINNRRASLS